MARAAANILAMTKSFSMPIEASSTIVSEIGIGQGSGIIMPPGVVDSGDVEVGIGVVEVGMGDVGFVALWGTWAFFD